MKCHCHLQNIRTQSRIKMDDEVERCIINGGTTHECMKEWLDIKTLETHVYIIYGAFGGLIVLLVVSMFFACGMLFDLKKQLKNLSRNGGGGGGGGQMKPHDPLQQRGYEAYTGNQGQGMARQQSIVAAPPIQGPGYGAPAPNRNSQVQGQRQGAMSPPPGAGGPSRRPTSGFGYDNHAGGYDSGYERDRAAGGVRVLPGGKAPQKDWGSRLEKGMDKFDKVQGGFEKFQDVSNFADNAGISEQVFGGNIGDIPGMDVAGDISGFAGDMGGFAGDAAGAAQFGKAGMGAFKNKGFGKSAKLW